MDDRLAIAQQQVAYHAEAIARIFRPGAQVTVLVRNPDGERELGAQDLILTSDTMEEILGLVTRRTAAAATQNDGVLIPTGYDPLKHGMTAKTEVDRLAILLFEAFAKAEPRHDITLYPTSYWSTFADMARAIIADRSAAAASQPADYVLVPRAATEAMQRAFAETALQTSIEGVGGWHAYARVQWATMLAATPRYPAVQPVAVEQIAEAIRARINAPLTGPTHGAWDRGRIGGLREALAIVREHRSVPSPDPTGQGGGDVHDAARELLALATLIERPPLDDVMLDRELALRIVHAILTVLPVVDPDLLETARG